MIRSFLFSVAGVVGVMASAQNLNNVTWNPSAPDECDYIAMNLIGNFPGQNYAPDSFDVSPSGFTITINLYCSGGGGGGQTPFSQATPASGPYVAGSYSVIGQLWINGNMVDTWTGNKTVTPATIPDPGLYNEVTLCNSDPNAQLITFLAGTPDPGGVWLDPNGTIVTNGIFDPGQSQQGFYTYEFDQNFPCVDTMQQILVTYEPNSNAGLNGSQQVCVNAPAFQLFPLLGGTPDANGSWTYQGNSVSSTFTPGTSAAGAYVYTVPGIPPCGNPTSTVTVTVTQPGNAGVGGSVQVCETDTSFTLNTVLTGSPSTTGTWYDPNGFSMLNGYNAHVNALVDFPGSYEYRVTVAPCAATVATVVVSYTNAEPPCGEDCLGVEGGPAQPGTACNDNNPNTINDQWSALCVCIGIPIGIEEPSAAAAMVLQPNPATDAITIDSPAGLVLGYDMHTVDGRLVRSTVVNAQRATVQRDGLANGSYHITIRFADGRATRTIVFE